MQRPSSNGLFNKPSFTQTKNKADRIVDFANQNDLDGVFRILKEVEGSPYEHQALLNIAGESFARYGHKENAKEMQKKGADPVNLAVGFLRADNDFNFNLCLAAIPAEKAKRADALNTIVFEVAKRGLYKQVEKILALPDVAIQKAILGYEHGGHSKHASALFNKLTLDKDQKTRLMNEMRYGHEMYLERQSHKARASGQQTVVTAPLQPHRTSLKKR